MHANLCVLILLVNINSLFSQETCGVQIRPLRVPESVDYTQAVVLRAGLAYDSNCLQSPTHTWECTDSLGQDCGLNNNQLQDGGRTTEAELTILPNALTRNTQYVFLLSATAKKRDNSGQATKTYQFQFTARLNELMAIIERGSTTVPIGFGLVLDASYSSDPQVDRNGLTQEYTHQWEACIWENNQCGSQTAADNHALRGITEDGVGFRIDLPFKEGTGVELLNGEQWQFTYTLAHPSTARSAKRSILISFQTERVANVSLSLFPEPARESANVPAEDTDLFRGARVMDPTGPILVKATVTSSLGIEASRGVDVGAEYRYLWEVRDDHGARIDIASKVDVGNLDLLIPAGLLNGHTGATFTLQVFDLASTDDKKLQTSSITVMFKQAVELATDANCNDLIATTFSDSRRRVGTDEVFLVFDPSNLKPTHQGQLFFRVALLTEDGWEMPVVDQFTGRTAAIWTPITRAGGGGTRTSQGLRTAVTIPVTDISPQSDDRTLQPVLYVRDVYGAKFRCAAEKFTVKQQDGLWLEGAALSHVKDPLESGKGTWMQLWQAAHVLSHIKTSALPEESTPEVPVQQSDLPILVDYLIEELDVLIEANANQQDFLEIVQPILVQASGIPTLTTAQVLQLYRIFKTLMESVHNPFSAVANMITAMGQLTDVVQNDFQGADLYIPAIHNILAPLPTVRLASLQWLPSNCQPDSRNEVDYRDRCPLSVKIHAPSKHIIQSTGSLPIAEGNTAPVTTDISFGQTFTSELETRTGLHDFKLVIVVTRDNIFSKYTERTDPEAEDLSPRGPVADFQMFNSISNEVIEVDNFPEEGLLSFQIPYFTPANSTSICGFFRVADRGWISTGVSTTSAKEVMTCFTNHLTPFSVIQPSIIPQPDDAVAPDDKDLAPTEAPPEGDGELEIWLLLVIVGAILLLCILFCIIVFCCCDQKTKSDMKHNKEKLQKEDKDAWENPVWKPEDPTDRPSLVPLGYKEKAQPEVVHHQVVEVKEEKQQITMAAPPPPKPSSPPKDTPQRVEVVASSSEAPQREEPQAKDKQVVEPQRSMTPPGPYRNLWPVEMQVMSVTNEEWDGLNNPLAILPPAASPYYTVYDPTVVPAITGPPPHPVVVPGYASAEQPVYPYIAFPNN
eukprot:TRINITY_DN54421_c0_g1_i1.p1 TRINITY_DN54421_c0_g1~~TRINITY_DN54421_c0_g1_i1.p1  ORF type:complete len:1134 (-),score=102.99 TRINITY_DN54421_c0_g1_i1:179-3580(-)